MNPQVPLPVPVAAAEEARCFAASLRLLLGRRLHQPSDNLGRRLRFADGSAASVYRETLVVDAEPREACALVVRFRLRLVRGWGHTAFRWESELNTPLFVGFPGFVSKLWLAHDQQGYYRGVYDWDGPDRAERYARSLWRVLALLSQPESIGYIVLPGLRRDQLVTGAPLDGAVAAEAGSAWWRPVQVE
jgi:hypothetical protein